MAHQQQRILLVDDNESIHNDFKKLLEQNHSDSEINELRSQLFDDKPTESSLNNELSYEISSAYQGQEALELVKKSICDEKPYSVAIIDSRMPPGWDGIYTIARLWEVDPNLQIIICTAYSDYSLDEIRQSLKQMDSFIIIKKPFEAIEIQQAVSALASKWLLNKIAKMNQHDIDEQIRKITKNLEETIINLKNKYEKV